MSIRKYLVATALASAAVVASPASATLLQFQITGGSQTVTFNLDSNPTPDSFNTAGGRFTVYQSVSIGSTRFDNSRVDFSSDVSDNYQLIVTPAAPVYVDYLGYRSSVQLFSGANSSPMFSVGTYSLSQLDNTRIGPSTLTISLAPDVTPAVPEPATWAMMLVGFGMIGGAARYRHRSVKVSHA